MPDDKPNKIYLDKLTMEVVIFAPVLEERPSNSGKSVVHFNSGMKFTPIDGTNLLYKLIIIRSKKEDTILKTE